VRRRSLTVAKLLSESEHADLKSGGVRVIYYFYDCDVPLFALNIYGKSDQADLTPEQRKAATAFAAAIKAARRAN